MKTEALWMYTYTVREKTSNNVTHSKLKYVEAPSESKVKEFISRDTGKAINIPNAGRWKTIRNHNNVIYCKKENSMYSILAKIKLLQPPRKEDSCLTPQMLECNAS